MTASKQSYLDCAWKRSSKTCMKLTSAKYTVENSWRWAEKMLETCRVLWQNKIGIIIASGWLCKKKSITVHDRMNVKRINHTKLKINHSTEVRTQSCYFSFHSCKYLCDSCNSAQCWQLYICVIMVYEVLMRSAGISVAGGCSVRHG
jgi:hypothetical protein